MKTVPVSGSSMGCPRCGAATRRVLTADRSVTACVDCHHLDWQDLAVPKRFRFQHHVRCLQEEIRQAEDDRDEEPVEVHVLGAEREGKQAVLRTQVVEGDPRRLATGAVLRAEAPQAAAGIAREAEVAVLKKHKDTVLVRADRASWARLPEGARVRVTPRSSAQIQRTLLQAYLLTRRIDPRHEDLEEPGRLPRIPRKPPAGVFTDGLRPSQARAVQAAIALPDDGLLLVQGPPGTGKTTVIASMVRNAVKRRWSVLVASHTHVAIDNALRRLVAANPLLLPKVARIGDPGSVAPDLATLVHPLSAFVEPDDQPDARPLWRSLYAERPVVGMTLDGLAHGLVRHQDQPLEPFDLVIVDEAGMNLLPKLAVARAAGRRLVLVGDHQQLPPIVTAPSFRNDPAYRKSPFEVLQAARGDLLVLLDEQFRCHPDLYSWSADAVYGGRVTSRRPPGAPVPALLGHALRSPVAWVDTSRLPGNADERVDGSRVNRLQALVAARVVEELVRDHGFPLHDIGYISPFRRQAELYTETVRRLGLRDADVLASTVDAFQGDERMAVVLDLTSTTPAKPHEDPRRLNVSLTRARDLLVLVGPRPYVARPDENPWLWSLQNWRAAETVPCPPGLVPARLLEQVRLPVRGRASGRGHPRAVPSA